MSDIAHRHWLIYVRLFGTAFNLKCRMSNKGCCHGTFHDLIWDHHAVRQRSLSKDAQWPRIRVGYVFSVRWERNFLLNSEESQGLNTFLFTFFWKFSQNTLLEKFLTFYVMHQQFNIQQLYTLPTLYLCVFYLSENKQRLVPLTA